MSDLRSIYSYFAVDSPIYAEAWVEKLLTKVELLKDNPRLGRIVPEFGIETLRELLEGNYRIVYKINFNHIGIVRIHHSSRILRI